MADLASRISIKYEGLDADSHRIDFVDLGHSLVGAGRLIRGAAGAVGFRPALGGSTQIRILAGAPQEGSVEIVAWLTPVAAMLPIFQPAATRAIEALVNYMIAKFTKRTSDADKAFNLAKTALEEMGMTSRTAIETIGKVASGQHTSVKSFVSPIGDSVLTARIGDIGNGAIDFDSADKEAIETPDIAIGDESAFQILISEIDIKNKTCKFALHGDEKKRYAGQITDPTVQLANNPYSLALAERKWLSVRAKPETIDDELTYLYISDSN